MAKNCHDRIEESSYLRGFLVIVVNTAANLLKLIIESKTYLRINQVSFTDFNELYISYELKLKNKL